MTRFFLLAIFCAGNIGQAFGQMSCCSKKILFSDNAQLAADSGFKNNHLEPLPFSFVSSVGKMIRFSTKDGKTGSGFFIDPISPSNQFIFVFHEWWGLNDYIKKETKKLAQSFPKANILAIDLYDGKVASSRDSASHYMGTLTKERAENIINGAIEFAGKRSRIASIGWCFGGGWSLQCALLCGSQSSATVIYYGLPEENIEKLKKLESPVLFVFAEKDAWINKEIVSKFEINMKDLDKKLTVLPYSADHAFANPSNPKFNPEFMEDAYRKSTEFLKKNMR